MTGIKENEIDIFKWGIGILITVLFALTGVLYTKLTSADDVATQRDNTLQSQVSNNTDKIANLQSNIYIIGDNVKIICVALQVHCTNPIPFNSISIK